MSDHAKTEETQIKSLLEAWADAVRRHDVPAILAHHEPDMVMFDLPPPLQCRDRGVRTDLGPSFPLSQARNGLRHRGARRDGGPGRRLRSRDHALRSRLVQQPGGQGWFPVPAHRRPPQGRRRVAHSARTSLGTCDRLALVGTLQRCRRSSINRARTVSATPASSDSASATAKTRRSKGSKFRCRLRVNWSASGRYCCKSRRGAAVEFKFERNESGRAHF
jgi:hypothetical protein